MEKIGTGIKRIRNFCKENNNDVEIKPTETHFFVKMKALDRSKDGVKVDIKDGVKGRGKLNETQKKLLELVLEDKKITMKELAEKIGITTRGVEKNISKLKEKGLLVRIGPDKTGYWKVEA
jgi:ATP-dependent DNA helicase RecG